MATRRGKRVDDARGAAEAELPADGILQDGVGPETTGRFVVILKDEATGDPRAVRSTLASVAGLKNIPASQDYEGAAVDPADFDEADAVDFTDLGILIVSSEEAFQSLAASASEADSPILAVEPEYVAYPSSASGTGLSIDYLRGYRDAVNKLYDEAAGIGPSVQQDAEMLAGFGDSAQFTWGLQATGVSTCPHGGQGIRVAVLDTGLDMTHPDFRGRAIDSRSFVAGIATAQDIHGHGTHCVGTACGSQRPNTGVRRYGVAWGSHIFVAKVFNNNMPRPSAPTGSVIAGIEWALANGCRIASLSLGVRIDQKILQYEVPIRRALDAGLLVVAAAGNNADRPASVGFVEPPANADAAMAVAALDSQLRIARFSARSSGVTGNGGLVNIAAPGVRVFSSVPVARGSHAFFDGTSMATPHVAGIAALWSQVTGLTGTALWNKLVQTVRPLALPSSDVGMGLVQAPR
jgi:subtilisin family serine protease